MEKKYPAAFSHFFLISRLPFLVSLARVPLGFICGYPVDNSGEQYGGSMFIKSAAADRKMHQSQAIQSANERWGEGRWCGRETIGIHVCKKKYSPFNFSVETQADGRKVVKVERMFGCPHHSKQRKRVIERHGERDGWEPFGQWSLKKAQELARGVTRRVNGDGDEAAMTMDEETSMASSSCSSTSLSSSTSSSEEDIRSICHNGKCAWKLKSKYDDVYEEITSQQVVGSDGAS